MGDSVNVDQSLSLLGRRHVQIGWVGVLVFLTLGMALELFLGFRIGYYLDVDNETRRLMWRLAHAHGTLLALVNLAFGATCLVQCARPRLLARWASPLLAAATLLLPGGFFLGGLVLPRGEPGPGVFLVPAGALMLLVAIAMVVRDTFQKS